MKNERDVKKALKTLFTKQGVWYFMPVMTGFGTQGIPDFIGSCAGQTFAVEAKFGHNEPTEIQIHKIEEMREHGVAVWVVSNRNFAEFSDLFPAWCEAIRACNK